MFGLGLKPEHVTAPPRGCLLVLAFIAGMFAGGAIVLYAALDVEPPLCSRRSYDMPEVIVRPDPDRQYDA